MDVMIVGLGLKPALSVLSSLVLQSWSPRLVPPRLSLRLTISWVVV